MGRKRLMKRSVVCGVIVLLSLLMGGQGWAQKEPYTMPRTIYWATADVGASLYAIPATVADKIGPTLGAKIRLIPGNDMDRVVMIRLGKAHLAAMAADTYWATMGLSNYSSFGMGPQDLRIIWAGWPFAAGSTGFATKSSGIKTPYDLKGKRVGIVVGAAWSIEGVKASLAWAKLTLDDVKVVEVSTSGAMLKALAEGKIDFSMGTVNAPGFYEAEASPHGAYIVRYSPEDKEGWARYRKFMPYHMPGYTTVGATVKPGEKIPTAMYPFPIMTCLADQNDEIVYRICKAIYGKMQEIVPAYPGNDAMRPERAIIPEITVMAPFHPGAVRFYREIGRWNNDLEEAQNKKLAHIRKLQKRWGEFVEEAQARIAKTNQKVDVMKEWREVVEKDIGLTAD